MHWFYFSILHPGVAACCTPLMLHFILIKNTQMKNFYSSGEFRIYLVSVQHRYVPSIKVCESGFKRDSFKRRLQMCWRLSADANLFLIWFQSFFGESAPPELLSSQRWLLLLSSVHKLHLKWECRENTWQIAWSFARSHTYVHLVSLLNCFLETTQTLYIQPEMKGQIESTAHVCNHYLIALCPSFNWLTSWHSWETIWFGLEGVGDYI